MSMKDLISPDDAHLIERFFMKALPEKLQFLHNVIPRLHHGVLSHFSSITIISELTPALKWYTPKLRKAFTKYTSSFEGSPKEVGIRFGSLALEFESLRTTLSGCATRRLQGDDELAKELQNLLKLFVDLKNECGDRLEPEGKKRSVPAPITKDDPVIVDRRKKITKEISAKMEELERAAKLAEEEGQDGTKKGRNAKNQKASAAKKGSKKKGPNRGSKEKHCSVQ